jgi:hypothetical protein
MKQITVKIEHRALDMEHWTWSKVRTVLDRVRLQNLLHPSISVY